MLYAMNATPFPLPEEFYQFVEQHADEEPSRLRLDFHGKQLPFDVDFAITQIECRRKFAKKLPSFVADPKFVFPSVVSGEQATNEAVARFHVSLLRGEDQKIIDMTAGLGIDAMSFAEAGHFVEAIEIDLLKQQCLLNNSQTLGLKRLRPMCADSTILFGRGNFQPNTVIFIDPHRRDSKGGRVYGLKDCVPDVTELLRRWEGEAPRVFLKLSPMLDIAQTLRDLPYARNVWAVCWKGECKEILVETELKSHSEDVLLTAIDLDESGVISEFSCSREFAKVSAPVISAVSEIEPGNYLYVPSAGMMKLGAWGAVCARFPGLMKLSASTPLFISSWLYRTFPGKVLTIEDFIGSSALKKMKGQRATVIARNYPLSAEQLRKKSGLKEGNEKVLVGAKVGSKATPELFLCSHTELESEIL